MIRKIYLEGSLGDKFIPEFTADVPSVQEAIKLVSANFPGFKPYLIDCHEKGVGFTIHVGEKSLEEEDMLFSVSEGDIVISQVPAGSKSGGGKIIAAIALIAMAVFVPTLLTFQGSLLGSAVTVQGSLGAALAGSMGGLAQAFAFGALSLGLNLAMAGIQQLMAPDPSTDSDEPTSYMFNGSQQNVVEGDPVPILYGELRVPGTPIAFSVVNNAKVFNAGTGAGDSRIVGTQQGLEVDSTSLF